MKVKETEHELIIKCPACSWHSMPKSRWTLSGTLDKPTISPSLIETSNPKDSKHYNPEYPTRICHLKVTDGKIEFLNDCTHDFAGKVVDLEVIG